MANIAGVESIDKLHGVLVNRVGTTSLESCIPSDEVYSRQDVFEIIKRYDCFRSCFDVAEDAGDSKEDAFGYAKYFLKNKYDGKYWEGINDFMEQQEIERKWFVKRKYYVTGGNMLYCDDDGVLSYNNNKEHATLFDTKEEAEKWTNPLTEAVLLPVSEDLK